MTLKKMMCLIGIASVLLLISSPIASQETSASLSACEGRVEVRAAGADAWGPARVGQSVQGEDKIRVEGGRVVLRFSNGRSYEVRGPAAGSVASFAAEAELKQLLESTLGPGGAEEKRPSGSGGRAFKGGITGAGAQDAKASGARVQSTDLSLSEEVAVAVMPFEVNAPSGELQRLGQNVHKLLLGRLGEIEGVRFVERSQLAKTVEEMKLSQTGLVDPSKAVEAGKMVGARTVILGEVTSFPPMVDLNARVVEVETGAIVGQPVHASGTGSKEAFRMISDLATALGDVLRSEYKYRAPGPGAPRYDIAYVLDSTGSMGEALEDLRDFIDTQLVKLNRRSPVPDIRIAVVDYKDRTDPYVANKLDFVPYTESDRVLQYLNGISASGGGDYPECVYTALMVTLRDLSWDLSPQVTRMAFLLADSPPHTIYPDEPTMEQVTAAATERNISLRVIGFQNLNNSGARTFEKLASLTNGFFQRYGSRSRAGRAGGPDAARRDLDRLKAEGTRGSKGGILTSEGSAQPEAQEPFLGDMLLEGFGESQPGKDDDEK